MVGHAHSSFTVDPVGCSTDGRSDCCNPHVQLLQLEIINVACISCALIAATVKKSVDEVLRALGHCIRLGVA